MSDAPERIWVELSLGSNDAKIWIGGSTSMLPEYIRADLAAAKDARIAELERQLDATLMELAETLALELQHGAVIERLMIQLAEARDNALEEAAMFIQSADAPVFDYSDGPQALADTMKAARIFAAAIRGLKGTKP